MAELQKDEHPLTERYISLVAEGFEGIEAALQLVGPELPREVAAAQCFRWESDPLVQHRIEMRRQLQQRLKDGVKKKSVTRLLAMAFSDMRNYFTTTGIRPIHEWSLQDAQAVRKIKFRESTDPFGTVTKTFDLEFYDPIKSLLAIKDLFPDELEDMVKDYIDVTDISNYTEEQLEDVRRRILASE